MCCKACKCVSGRTTTTLTLHRMRSPACLRQRKNEPDLILLDLGLPAGDGFLLMDRFKNVPALAAVPVIVVTGRDVRDNRKRVIEAGARALLQKPVDNAKLLGIIRQALGEHPRTEEEPMVYNLKNP